MTRNTQQDGGN